MRFLVQALIVTSVCFFLGCVSSSIRLPASFKAKYNSKIVTSLKTAAVNGVLFQINDSVFRDVPVKQVDSCRKSEAPNWSASFLGLLEVLDKNPQHYNKFHMVDFKRGDKARAEISKDIDGLSYLNITYAKRETREKVTPMTALPCPDGISEYLGKDMVVTYIDWPTTEEISLVLKQAQAKGKIERFQFNTEFLVFLAERQTVLKINPEVAFERSFQGEFFLSSWLERMAQEIRQKDAPVDFINYWMKEISTNSKQANVIQFFGLNSENTISYGVKVDTVGKFSRKLNNFQEPTYLFMTFREQNGEYVSSKLSDLNLCLQTLLGIYRNPLLMASRLESEGESFLAPGYTCKLEAKD